MGQPMGSLVPCGSYTAVTKVSFSKEIILTKYEQKSVPRWDRASSAIAIRAAHWTGRHFAVTLLGELQGIGILEDFPVYGLPFPTTAV